MRPARTRRRPAAALAAGARWLLCVLLVVPFTAAAALGQRGPYVGYVFELRGRWVSEDGAEVSKGSTLRAGERVHVRSPSPDDFIVIVNKTGSAIARRSCNSADECARPIVVWQTAPPRPSRLRVVADSVWDLLFGKPGVAVAIRSREGAELLDGIAELSGGRVNLGTSFRKLPEGEYYLSMQSVGRPGTAAAGRGRVRVKKIKWGPKSSPIMSEPGLRPGLYEIALHREGVGGETIPMGATAWVLVGRPNAFRNYATAQQEAQALTDGWGDAVSPESKRDFLRAHLAHLAGWGTR